MSEQIPFQYAILRYMHDVVTGEFLNVGLVVYSYTYRYCRIGFLSRYSRITNTFPGADGEYFKQYITHLERKFNRFASRIDPRQPQMFEELPDRLEEFLALVLPVDDSSIQFSNIYGGLAPDLDGVFIDLYRRLIERYIEVKEETSRDDEQIWTIYSRPLKRHNILRSLQPKTIITPRESFTFENAWKNGKWNLLQPLSFDLIDPFYIRRKARTWLGTNMLMNASNELGKLFYLLGAPRDDDRRLHQAYNDAKDILTENHFHYGIELVEEDAAENFALEIKPQVEKDLEQYAGD